MCKCKTKTFVQVCRGADCEEMESGPSKTVAQRRFCWVRTDCLLWEVKQETYLEFRNAKHRRQGHDRELFNNLPLTGEEPHCSILIMPKK